MIPTLAQLGSRFWMPDDATTYGYEIDYLFYFIYWVSVASFVLIIALMTFFVLRYRHRPGHAAQPSPSHSTSLELTWTFIPTVALLAMFYWGFKGHVDASTPPDYAYEINVTAFKWGWSVQYPNGATSPDLHIPHDVPVKLILHSDDVIHSLYVPAFRMKKDLVPGRVNAMWFHVKEKPPVRSDGESYFDLYCAEYCGDKHSVMRAKVFVHERDAFIRWLDEAANWVVKEAPAVAGAKLYQTKGCTQCHSIDGKAGIGPSFKNIFGYEHKFKDGLSAKVDEAYVRESILNPNARVVAGFDPVMPTYQGRMKDVEIIAITEWLKTLSDKGPAPLEAFPAELTSKAAPGNTPASPAPAPASTPADAVQGGAH